MVKYIVRENGHGVAVYGNNLDFLRCKDSEVLCSGPADTGKTYALCLKLHLCASKYSGASIAMVRKTQTSCYNTVVRTFTEKILGTDSSRWPCVPYGGFNRPTRFNYYNGSGIDISGLDKPSRLLSSEFDLIGVAQTEEIGLYDWQMLTTRATGRAGHMPYAQTIGDCNPGPPTHWIRSRARDGKLTLFESTHQDNPELYNQETGQITPEGEQRLGRLQNLSGPLLLRLYHGLWAAPEGAIYDVFDEEKHKVKAFDPPLIWPRAVGVDPVGAYIAGVWAAFDPESGILNIYREYYGPFGETTPGHTSKMIELSKGETIFAWYGGAPSERQQRTDFAGAGIPLLQPQVGDLWVGIDRVYQMLKEFALVIHDSCPQLLSEIGDYRRKLKAGVPSENIENKSEYHCLDALRYLIIGLTEPQPTTEFVYRPAMIGARW